MSVIERTHADLAALNPNFFIIIYSIFSVVNPTLGGVIESIFSTLCCS